MTQKTCTETSPLKIVYSLLKRVTTGLRRRGHDLQRALFPHLPDAFVVLLERNGEM